MTDASDDWPEVFHVIRRHVDQLMSNPNVTGVGEGKKDDRSVIEIFFEIPDHFEDPDDRQAYLAKLFPSEIEGYGVLVTLVGENAPEWLVRPEFVPRDPREQFILDVGNELGACFSDDIVTRCREKGVEVTLEEVEAVLKEEQEFAQEFERQQRGEGEWSAEKYMAELMKRSVPEE